MKGLTSKPSRLLKLRASSTMALVASFFLPLMTPDVVTTTRDLQSATREASDSAENPAKTTEWTAPMRAHASMVIGSSPVTTSTICDRHDGLADGLDYKSTGQPCNRLAQGKCCCCCCCCCCWMLLDLQSCTLLRSSASKMMGFDAMLYEGKTCTAHIKWQAWREWLLTCHGHVDGNSISLLDALSLKPVGLQSHVWFDACTSMTTAATHQTM